MTKRICVAFIIVLLLTLVGIQGFTLEKAKIAIFMWKPSAEIYDRIMDGIKETFNEAGYRENRNLVYDYFEARKDVKTAAKMVEKIKSSNYDLVISLGTKSTQILQEYEVTEVPVLFSGVFDPVNAGIVSNLDGSGTNYAGSSHRQIFSKQFSYFLELVPTVKRLGAIYRQGEPNSLVQLAEVQGLSASLGIDEVISSPAQDADDLKRAIQELVGKVDAIYLPADILVSSPAALNIRDVALTHKIPVFSALVDPTKYGALVSVYTDLYVLGRQVGRIAIRILNGVDTATMPVEFQQVPNIMLNRITAEYLELEIPAGMQNKITGIIGRYIIIATGE